MILLIIILIIIITIIIDFHNVVQNLIKILTSWITIGSYYVFLKLKHQINYF